MGTILDKIYEKEDEIDRSRPKSAIKYTQITYNIKCHVCNKDILLIIQHWGHVTSLEETKLLCNDCSIKLEKWTIQNRYGELTI